MNIRHFGTVASVLTMIAASSSSAAQDRPASVEPAPAAATTAVPEQPTNPCEIHVWPAERFSALTTGWLSGFAIGNRACDTEA